jgi:hypothetical protein
MHQPFYVCINHFVYALTFNAFHTNPLADPDYLVVILAQQGGQQKK